MKPNLKEILAFIGYRNPTMAQPIKWTSTGIASCFSEDRWYNEGQEELRKEKDPMNAPWEGSFAEGFRLNDSKRVDGQFFAPLLPGQDERSARTLHKCARRTLSRWVMT